MLKNIPLGVYIPGNSMLHRADPRVKIICSLLFALMVFIAHTITALTISLGFIISVAILSGLPLIRTLKGLRPLWILILLTTVINIFTNNKVTSGPSLHLMGNINLSIEYINTSIVLSLRLIALVINSAVLTLTTIPSSFANGMERLLLPLKIAGINPKEIAMMISISIRFIPVLFEEADRITSAQISRGVDLKTGSIIKRAKNYIPILIPVIVNSLARADELTTAMESRCYGLYKSPTRFNSLHINNIDLTIITVMVLYCLVIIYLCIFY